MTFRMIRLDSGTAARETGPTPSSDLQLLLLDVPPLPVDVTSASPRTLFQDPLGANIKLKIPSPDFPPHMLPTQALPRYAKDN